VTATQRIFINVTENDIKAVLTEVLGLGQRGAALTSETALLGALPELDSMAVATVLTALEERFDLVIDDGDLSAETFETVGSLTAFIAELGTARGRRA
jgi:acyl carrier protein